MENRFLNRIKNYHFGRCLIHLYQVKGIDTSISSRGRGRNAGWATGVATEMFNLGLLEFNDGGLDVDAKKNRTKQKSSIVRRLQEHLKTASAENVSGLWLSIYCGYFGCSCDYLMGYIEKPTYQDTDIYQKTGLEEYSIRTLKKVKNNWDKKEKNTLNYIMKNSDLFLDFLEWLSIYIDNDYTVPLAYDKEKGEIPCNNVLGNVVLGKEIKDNKGNDGYKTIGIGVDILESHAMLKMQEIIGKWKNSK